jgi:23S rRNA pseudouridine1911/1915/1917 synthase
VSDNADGALMEVLEVPHSADGRRVDKFISANAPDDFSRARVQALVRAGKVTVNGIVPKGTSVKVFAGDVVRFEMPAPEDATPEPQDIPLTVLFEDDDLIVINKPAGLVVHPAPGNSDGTLVNALLHHCAGQLSGIGGVRRPGIVHRLDKDTSGVMVAAKSYRAHIDLQEQFADHGRTGPLERAYYALVWGVPPRMKGKIATHLGRHPTARTARAVVEPGRPDAKYAVTHYEVLETLGETKRGVPIASLVECRLETGRTHQIRVHMAHIGCPLLGDREYGRKFASKGSSLGDEAGQTYAALGRQALHARLLGFRHPMNGETVRFEAPVPDDMRQLMRALG